VFPPSTEVGGRRWNKFAKAIYKLGGEVTVISSDMGMPNSKNLQLPDYIKSHQLIKNKYPEVLSTAPQSILDKIKYRLALSKVKKTSNGNYYDRGIFAESELYALLKNTLNDKPYDKVIVTGAPFSILYYLSLWKNEFGYQLICDIRDPWTFGDSYGINNLEKLRFEEEGRRESLVFENCNMVTVPNQMMRAVYIDKYAKYKSKIKVLPHGFDENEFKNLGNVLKVGFDNWLYGGTLYSECKDWYHKLFTFVDSQQQLSMDVYGRTNPEIQQSYQSVNFREIVNPQEFNEISNQKDCFIWIFPERFKDYLSTKLFELIRCRIPIVYIGFEGAFSEFILENDLGVFVNKELFLKDVNQINISLKKLKYNMEFPIEDYTTDNIIASIL
jgi:glycosyltransferase involved in cell wall biosynthesis